jgi:hypothetical protein
MTRQDTAATVERSTSSTAGETELKSMDAWLTRNLPCSFPVM